MIEIKCSGCGVERSLEDRLKYAGSLCPNCREIAGAGVKINPPTPPPQTDSRKLKIWAMRVVIFAVVGFLLSFIFRSYSPGPSGIDAVNQSPEPTSGPPPAFRESWKTGAQPPPVIRSYDVQDLYDAYNANEVAADFQFKDSIFKVKGCISSIDKDFLDNVVIRLFARDEHGYSVASIDCHMAPGQEIAASKLHKCECIWLKGIGGGMVLRDPQMTDCIYLDKSNVMDTCIGE